MADTKLTALGSVTPVLTDITYVVDDPGGTPISGKMTLQALMDLFEANIQLTESNITDLANYLTDIVGDTTPQLGGQLDVNGNAIGDGTRELLTFTEDASAVNHVNIENEATGSGPIISAAGDDTNIDLNLLAKGGGNIVLGTITIDADATVGAGQDNYVLTYNHSAGTWGPEVAQGGISEVATDTTPQLGGNLDLVDYGLTIQLQNDNASPITKGQIVYVNSSGNVDLADADAASTTTSTIGMVSGPTINAAATGPITVFGVVDGIDTSSLTAGGLVYLSGTAGGFTATQPTSGNIKPVGVCLEVNASTGRILFTGSGGWAGIPLANGAALKDVNDNELIEFGVTGSAVNHVTITNATTGNPAVISVAETNSGISIQGNGTGNITLGNYVLDGDQTVGAGQDNYVLTYDNGTGLVSLEAAASGGNVSNTGTPVDGQIAIWTAATTVEGDASLTFDTTDDTLVIAASGKLAFGAVDVLSDSSGTTTLQNIDALDATTTATVVSNLVGQQHLYIPAAAMISRTTSGAAAGSTELATNDVMIESFDFDTAADEHVQFSLQMPKNWNEGTLVAQFIWSHPSTTTNFGVTWGIQAVALADGDAGDTAFGSIVLVDDTGGTTDDVYISPESSAITVAGTPGAEEWVVFQVFRDVSDANDTLAVDARLHGVKIHWTNDATNAD